MTSSMGRNSLSPQLPAGKRLRLNERISSSKMKHSRVDSVRHFPQFCGPFGAVVEGKEDGKIINDVVSKTPSEAVLPDNQANTSSLDYSEKYSYDAAIGSDSRRKVEEVLKSYKELLSLDEQGNGSQSLKAIMALKKEGRWLNSQPTFGHVPGVQIGDQFQFRAELVMVGLHHEFVRGINCVDVKGKPYAVSAVDSGRYENKATSPGVLVYSGQGGNSKVQHNPHQSDQTLEGGNLGLKNSMDAKFPVRVIRKIRRESTKHVFIYDGLYSVSKYWLKKSNAGEVYMFEMIRMSRQPDCNYLTIDDKALKSVESSRLVIAKDLSQGKEGIEIVIVNEINSEKPAPFTYITEMMKTFSHEHSGLNGCGCIDGCSDLNPCPCVIKNGGEIPFNEDGGILKAKKMIYECGPNCKCPPSCQNRVSQHGLKLPLEVFKTESTGWSVRSREEIKIGSFICEYLGELVEDKEADHCTNDEYLFDLWDGKGFTIDAAKYGNVSRFINHSCSPNLYAQNVIYDHGNKKLPHVMFFATENIPALVELTYHYNYKIGSVRDAHENIKDKKCFCGARRCRGRLY
ncbi:OLC1v1033609C1 [Oldenlandia corymbosa var. corymbosa]|uniref:OLC1v1033609C1 n=1 Tax=Oldenlandia corymbosa var. corymbosa TaxID=529605 RepID=A0AAV1CPX2_OLDCO|nr:OLC1v1033609C1 [Oldenlandia corymbosa var. corymbosa]